MAPEALAEAERLILKGDGLDAVCEALDCTRRTLERAFVAAYGTTPARWRKAQRGGKAAKTVPPVSFRLSLGDRAALVCVAEKDGVAPSEWARRAVVAALKHDRVMAALSGDDD